MDLNDIFNCLEICVNKIEMVVKLVFKCDFLKVQVFEIISCIFDIDFGIGIIVVEFDVGCKVCLLGFGIFLMKKCVVCKGCNFVMGVEIIIVVKIYLVFKVGIGFKDCVVE